MTGYRNYQIKLYILSVILWCLWTVRNKMSIEKVFLGSSKEVFYKILICLQKWRRLLKEDDAIFMDDKISLPVSERPQWLSSGPLPFFSGKARRRQG